VHVQRDDVLGQAVSWARAEQTGCWQQGDRASAEPRLDLEQIDDLVRTVREHNAAWQTWFEQQGVEPYRVRYEDVVADPRRAVQEVLDRLGVDLPSDWRPESPHRRQADEVNADWVRRYRAAR
jgi:LPS sulfotransferase NodH